GLYRGSAALHGSKLTGVDDPFEEPLNPDLTVDTATESIEESTNRILTHLTRIGFVQPLVKT
ncbi:MAG: adenylyl-sulfate kinase, partial [Thermoplasmata archaeon]